LRNAPFRPDIREAFREPPAIRSIEVPTPITVAWPILAGGLASATWQNMIRVVSAGVYNVVVISLWVVVLLAATAAVILAFTMSGGTSW